MLSTLFSNHGVLGINARNLLYIRPFNPKKATAFADDKLKTKAYLTARGIPAAKIYARIETRDQLQKFDFSQLPDSCVLKPNYGFGGEGILVLRGRDKQGNFLNSKKLPITKEEMIGHIEDILDGRFSLGGRKDTAFFEQILVSHDTFTPFRPAGLPDIRIIVFNLVPVMAEVRIPTATSQGKANLHLGGIGLGVDIAKGTTTYGVQYDKIIKELPHGEKISGHQIAHWDEMLLVSSQIQYHTNIGYLAVDFAIDQTIGPAVLEVNARAGLAVQIANLAPLRKRLERVKGIKVGSPEKGVRIGQDLFGEKAEGTKVQKTSKPVLGLSEMVSIAGDGSSTEEKCLIAPDQERTTFTDDLIDELLSQDALEIEDEKEQTYRAKFMLGGVKLQTLIAKGEPKKEYRAIIGRRDLGNFLIDTSKKAEIKSSSSTKSDFRAVDKLFGQFDKELLLLKHVKPINLEEERKRLLADVKYNPVFSYAEIEADLDEIESRLHDEKLDDSPFGTLLERKRNELIHRIDLLRARGKDSIAFTAASTNLFGVPDAQLLADAKAMLDSRQACELREPASKLLDATAVKARFDTVLDRYGLHDWQVVLRPRLVADVTVGGSKVYIREGARFEPKRVEALIKHEIETHVLTSENGNHQPFVMFRRGFANYMETQEGLAMYNQNLVYGPYHDTYYNAPRNTLGLHYGLSHSFAETRRYMQEELGYSAEKSISQTITIKRGLSDTSAKGGFTKGVVYFRGLQAIESYVENGGDLTKLYVGKIALEDLHLVQKIPDLQKPYLIPDFIREMKK